MRKIAVLVVKVFILQVVASQNAFYGDFVAKVSYKIKK